MVVRCYTLGDGLNACNAHKRYLELTLTSTEKNKALNVLKILV